MPRIGREEPEAAAPPWEDFIAGFQRSKKGNLWRMYDNLTLTVFPRGHGYNWCVCDREGPLLA